MKRFPSIALISLAIAAPSARSLDVTWLHFDNGDSLSGHLVDLDEAGLQWQSPALAGPQVFHPDRIREIEVSPDAGLNLPEGNHIAVVTLTNGDEIKGCLTRVTDREIGLETSFAGELVFRRDMVEALRIEDRPEPIYVGPAGLDGWTQSVENGWKFESGALACHRASSIGRDIGRHDRVRIAFDMSWRENARFRLFLHADSDQPEDMSNGYELVCQSQYAYLRKRTANDSSTIGSSGGIREFTDRDKIRFEILHDLTTGRFRLIIEGRVIDDWQEPAPSPEKMGPFIHFAADRSNGTRISRILITSWDGLIDGEWGGGGAMRFFGRGGMDFENPEESEESEETADSPSNIRLRNGDRVEGEIVEITEGTVRLKTPFSEFQLPVARLSSFALRTAEEAADPELRWEPIRRNGDIRAWFSDGGRVTFQLTGFRDGTLVGRSQTFGEAAFDLGAFSRLEFNIYPRPTAPKG